MHGGSITSTHKRMKLMKRVFSDNYAYAYFYGFYFFEEKK